MNNKNPFGMIEVEITAEKIYYTIIGTENELVELIKISNKNKAYVISKLSVPLANVCEIESNNRNLNIIVGDTMEQMQCSILCDCSFKEEKESYALSYIELLSHELINPSHVYNNDNDKQKYALKYPEIIIKGNLEPDKYILDDLKKNIPNYPKKIEESIKLVDITGNLSDTLIYNIRINQIKKSKK